ncbi:hypothetical protein QAD02_023914 [Eretmocerus hayati]|uniref:Uncharacterized protein n=1 Tax=Eretmocerus hayati TaxID=131215 RepID=A0ACC2PWX2_9HYME|nr:hypothetical protein QAD02_023914 [Eretmocerus hayati]
MNKRLLDTTVLIAMESHISDEERHDVLAETKNLLKAGADPDFLDSDDGQTCMHYIAMHNEEQEALLYAELLLSAGASPDIVAYNGHTPLLLAIKSRNENEALIKKLIAAGANLNRVDWRQRTTLKNLCVEVTRILLSAGALPNVVDNEGKTPLVLATSSQGDYGDIVKCLALADGIDLDLADSKDMTSLHHAALQGKAEIVSILLSAGSEPNITTKIKKHSPLLSLAIDVQNSNEQHEDVIRQLITAGAHIDGTDSLNRTSLHYACLNGDEKMANLLMIYGAEPTVIDQNGFNALFFATMSENIQLVQKLIDAGMDINYINLKGSDCSENQPKTVLHLAIARCNIKMVEHLLKCGADLHRREGLQKSILLFALEFERSQNAPELMKLLLSYGADMYDVGVINPKSLIRYVKISDHHSPAMIISSAFKSSMSPFELLVSDSTNQRFIVSNVNRTAEIQILLEHGLELARYNPRSPEDFSPLHEAVRFGHRELLSLLLEFNTESMLDLEHVDKEGCSPLHIAVRKELHDCVELLLKSGAKVDCTDSKGRTPLQIVSILLIRLQGNSLAIMKLLLHYRADMYACRNGNSRSIFERFVRENLVSETRLLLEYGLDLRRYRPRRRKDFSPLHAAINVLNANMLSLLLEYDTNGVLNLEHENKRGQSPLFLAVDKKASECVKIMLKSGANVEHADSKHWTPLKRASWECCEECIQLLILAGAKLHDVLGDLLPNNLVDFISDNDDEYNLMVDVGHYNSRTREALGRLEKAKCIVKYRLLYESQSSEVVDLMENGNMGRSVKLWSFCDASKAEITRMKNSTIYESFSYYDVLTADEEFHKRVRDDQVYQMLTKELSDQKFPVYAEDLSKSVEHLKRMHCIWEAAVENLSRYLSQFFCADAHYSILRDIVNHLTEGDLESVADIKIRFPQIIDALFETYSRLYKTTKALLMMESGKNNQERVMYMSDLMIEDKENSNKPNQFTNGKSLLQTCERGKLEFVKILLHNGAPRDAVDENGFNALLFATKSGNVKLVRLLIDSGFDVNYVDEDFFANKPSLAKTALHVAIQSNDVEMLKFLLENGANPNKLNNLPGVGALYFAVKMVPSKILPMITLLLSHGADMYATIPSCNRICFVPSEVWTTGSYTLFEYLVAKNRVNEMRVFLDHGLDLARFNPRKPNQFSPLHITLILDDNYDEEDDTDMLSLLLTHSKKMLLNVDHVNEFGYTPLCEAAVRALPDHIHLLLKAGANVNYTISSKNRTALELAVLTDEIQYCPVENNGLKDARYQFRKAKCIVKYRVQYESKNSPVAEPVKNSNMGGSVKLRKYYEACKAEIEKLRKSTICNSITYYDVLIADSSFYKRVRNDRVYEPVDKKKIESDFPIYATDVNDLHESLKYMHGIWEKAVKNLGKLLQLDQDAYYLILSNILTHVKHVDLESIAGFL